MVGRRGVLGGAAAAVAMVLSGCGLGRKDMAGPAAEAAEAVAGVRSVELEQVTGSSFARALVGSVTLEAEDRGSGLAVWDEAMRAIVTVVHDEGDPETADRLRVGGITGVLADGTELTALDLEPDMPTEDPRLDTVSAGSFYGRYGLG